MFNGYVISPYDNKTNVQFIHQGWLIYWKRRDPQNKHFLILELLQRKETLFWMIIKVSEVLQIKKVAIKLIFIFFNYKKIVLYYLKID